MIQHSHPIAPWGSATCSSTLYFNASAPSTCLLQQLLLFTASASSGLDSCLVRYYEFLFSTPTLTHRREKVSFYYPQQVRIFAVFVAARCFGCHDTRVCGGMKKTAWEHGNSCVNMLIVSQDRFEPFPHESVVPNHRFSHLCQILKVSFFSPHPPFPSTQRPPLRSVRQLQAAQQLGFVWKRSAGSGVRGVSVTRLCALSRITSVSSALGMSNSVLAFFFSSVCSFSMF